MDNFGEHRKPRRGPYNDAMRPSLLLAFCSAAIGAHGAVSRIPIRSNLVLQPGAASTITLTAGEATEIGWQPMQPQRCATECVQATELTGTIHASISAPMGFAKKYQPESGKISVEYKNVSREPVTITVYRVKRTCEAEACRFLDPSQKTRWLVFKVSEFRSITTSKDASYSMIDGNVMSGRPFRIRAIWWTDDKGAVRVDCSPFVQRYLANHVPKEQYQPYIISGQATGEAPNLLLRVDTCAPRAPHFGVPEANVYK